MARFFISPESVEGNRITIIGREVHHLRNVLRLRKGEKVICFDGSGREYQGRIEQVSSRQAEIKIERRERLIRELPVKITLAQSLIRSNKMDLVIQKCTELGVFKIMPMKTVRCLVNLDSFNSQSRRERWQRIAEEAAKQSGQVKAPSVEGVAAFSSVLKIAQDFDLGIIPWEEEEGMSFKEVLKRASSPKNVLILIGPEGGFTAQEVAEAKKAGLIPISLGPRILRSETAAMATAAILAYEMGS